MSIFNRELLEKYLRGECSPEEESMVIAWFESSDLPADIDEALREKWGQTKVNPGNLERWLPLLEDTYDKINMDELLENLDGVQIENQEKKTKDRAPIRPQTKSRSFDKLKAFFFTIILILTVSVIYYQWNGQNNENQLLTVQAVQKQTQTGQRLLTKLPDGSIVKLNSKSTLRFPEQFTGDTREVFLEGEAFFDVAENKEHPFIIRTGEIDIKVLGTSFNVRSYGAETNKKVAVASGLVQVSNQAGELLHVSPDSMAVFSLADSKLNILPYNEKKELGWKDNLLYFDRTRLDKVFKMLEEWYGVVIELQEKVDVHERFSGSFNNESLENVLQNIELTFDLSFQIKGKKVYVYQKRSL